MSHAAAAEIFARVIRDKTNVVMVFPTGFDGASAMSSLEGHLVEADENMARFCIHPRFLKVLPVEQEDHFPALLPIEINFMATGRAENGSPVLLMVRSNSRLLTVDYGTDGRPSHLVFRTEENFAARPARRHARIAWKPEMHVNLRLGAITTLPATMSELRHFFETTLAAMKQQPQIVNISIGGACLAVPRLMAQQSQESENSYLFVFSTPGRDARSKPRLILCRQLGIRSDLSDEETVALRLQFISELDWGRSTEKLEWKDVSQTGSATINEFFRMFPKGINVWKKG